MSETLHPIDKQLTTMLYQKVIDLFADRATIYDVLADVTTDEKKRSVFVNEAIQNATDAETLIEEAKKRGLPIVEPEE